MTTAVPILSARPMHTRAVRLRVMRLLLAAAAVAVVPAAGFAQDSAAEARLRKIEAEVRALQRKVFPGGDGRLFEPQIAPGTEAPANNGQVMGVIPPATTPVTDILVRLDALEAQLQVLTARSEEQANQLGLIERRLAAVEAGQAPAAAAPAGPPAIERPAASIAATTPPPATATVGATTRPATTTPAPAATRPAVPAMTAGPSAERLAAVQAIAKPQTADAGDDEYSYGFRLWNAGFFPEARQQLTRFVEQYPNHSRISFGRNLLGRAYLDDNMPKEAAQWFLKNYQANKAGDRAPDSLLYLAQSMIALKDNKKACIALAEFSETYPLVASGRLADEYKANLAKVKCS
jgi:TolA-binding protein